MAKKTDRPPVPATLAQVALVGAETCAGIGEVSVSWWHEEVRAGRAPKPVIRQPRFTRWRLQDAERFWTERASRGTDAEAVGRLIANATQASRKAKALRTAAVTAVGQ